MARPTPVINPFVHRRLLTGGFTLAECLIASLRASGIGLKGKAGPFWCNRPDDMPWLISGVLVSKTLSRLAHAEGHYHTSLAEASKHGFLTPPTSEPAATPPTDDNLAA